jgi:hypothetical protein
MIDVSASGQKVYGNEQKEDFLLLPLARLFRHRLRKSRDSFGMRDVIAMSRHIEGYQEKYQRQNCQCVFRKIV